MAPPTTIPVTSVTVGPLTSDYDCAVVAPFGELGSSISPATVTMILPSTVSPNGAFDVHVDVTNGPKNGPIGASDTVTFSAQVVFDVANGTPDIIRSAPQAIPTEDAAANVPFPKMPRLTASGSAGTTGTVGLVLKHLIVTDGDVVTTCVPDSTVAGSIAIAGQATTTLPGQTTTTVAGIDQPTPTAAPTSAAGATTAPAPTSPPGQVAQLVTSRADVTYSCVLLNPDGSRFGTTELAPDPVTAHLTVPDKVQAGTSFTASLKLDPGVKNGPVTLQQPPTFRATVIANGSSSSPLNFEAVSSTGFAREVDTTTPDMSASVRAGSAGSRISYTMSDVEVEGTVGAVTVITRCSPDNATVFATTDVVSEPVAVAGSTTPLAFTGGNSSGMLQMATLLMLVGAMLVGWGRAQPVLRRT